MSNSGKSNLIVGIDSMTLVWGVRRQGPKENLQRARWLFESLEAERAQIVVPAIVVSEYLCPLDKGDHAGVISELRGRFIIPEFSVEAASVAAQLFMLGQSGRVKGSPDGRKVLRADSLIIATAATHQATIFYSGDKGCRSLADNVMVARPLPDQPPHLFGYIEPDKTKISKK